MLALALRVRRVDMYVFESGCDVWLMLRLVVWDVGCGLIADLAMEFAFQGKGGGLS